MGPRRGGIISGSTGFDSTGTRVAFGTAGLIVGMDARRAAILSGSTGSDSPAPGAADVAVGAFSWALIDCEATTAGSGVAGPVLYAA